MKIENYKLKIIFFGTPYFVLPVLDTLTEHFDVTGIVTTPDVIIGRKKTLTPTPIKRAYQEYLQNNTKRGLIIDSQQFNSVAIEQLKERSPDLFVVAAYGQIIPKDILAIPKYGSINIHPSLLPKYRGPSPIQSAILNGEKTSGVTVIQMDEEIDHGPILAKKEIHFDTTDTFESLHTKLFSIASSMLPDIITKYVSGEIKPEEQNHSEATFCEKITRQDGFFDIANPPGKDKLDRMVRAYFPWPTAWTKVRFKNQDARIMKLLPEKRIQLEGGKPMTIKDFLNGYPEMKEKLDILAEIS